MRVLSAEHVATAASPAGLPEPGLPEVALLGRSNVGKSSLLNRLAGRRALARTSATPGKTRLIHLYRVRRATSELLLVDLPGYGYARVSQRERTSWRELVEGYLACRTSLRLALLLQDARRDLTADELDLLAWLRERELPALPVFTKSDKLRAAERERRRRAFAEALGPELAGAVWTSASRGTGIDALWEAIEGRLGSGAAGDRGPGAGGCGPGSRPGGSRSGTGSR